MTPDGKFTVVEVECIAGCDRAPSIMVNDTYHEPVDVAKLDRLIEALSRARHRNEQCPRKEFSSPASERRIPVRSAATSTTADTRRSAPC